MPNKRQFPRKKRRLTVEFNWNKNECTGFTYDISASGMFVRSIRIPMVGSRLTIRILLPNEKHFPITGIVVRSFRVPPSLAQLIPSGFSLRITDRAPEGYLQYLAAL